MRILMSLATMLWIAGCGSFGASSLRTEEARATCDAWRSTIVVTEPTDRRPLREQELFARETYKEVCV